ALPILDLLWPETFVEESSLTQNISLLRRALTEGENDLHYIETIPKRGYRFVAKVNRVDKSTNGDTPETSSYVEVSPPQHNHRFASQAVRPLPDAEQHSSSRLNLYVAAVA